MTTPGVQVEYDAVVQFRNNSSRTLHLRKIFAAIDYTIMDGDNEQVVCAISKSPDAQALVSNGNPFFKWPIRTALSVATTGATMLSKNGGISLGRGQLTLEPDEAVFVIIIADANDIVITGNYDLGFEFGAREAV